MLPNRQNFHIDFEEPADKGGAGKTPDPNKPANNQVPETFEKFLEGQDQKIKELYDGHVKGLKSALGSERDTNTELNKQLKILAGKVEKGSDAEKVIQELTGKLDASEKHASFVEEASKPEIGCTNIKAAFLLATADNLLDKKGNPDWDAIRKAAPELFKKPVPDGNPGSGTNNKTEGFDMNKVLRQAVGRN